MDPRWLSPPRATSNKPVVRSRLIIFLDTREAVGRTNWRQTRTAEAAERIETVHRETDTAVELRSEERRVGKECPV